MFSLLLDLDFCKSGQVRSPDFHLNQQHQEEEDEALCSRTATHMHGRGYSLGVGSDMDTEPEVEPSPNHGLQHMWMHGLKSEQSSCLTSRANSALSLTDTEHDRKSEPDNGEWDFVFLKEYCLSPQKQTKSGHICCTLILSIFIQAALMEICMLTKHFGCLKIKTSPGHNN